ncbi:hypothetical protein AYI96_16145 [Shewanella sp. MSW]|nr:hypothetical protein BFS86_19370 [Shewanella algae]TVP09515.1 hypothetical protein AYI96_16145 [Shewanella sp. MSW]
MDLPSQVELELLMLEKEIIGVGIQYLSQEKAHRKFYLTQMVKKSLQMTILSLVIILQMDMKDLRL